MQIPILGQVEVTVLPNKIAPLPLVKIVYEFMALGRLVSVFIIITPRPPERGRTLLPPRSIEDLLVVSIDRVPRLL